MMKHELEELLGESVTEEDFRVIEVVYMWHPSALSKEKVAALYKEFGIALIKDMVPRADKVKKLEEKKRRAEGEIHALNNLIDAVKRGEDLSQIDSFEKEV